MQIYEKNGNVRMHVYVQPRASRTELVGEHGDSLKIRVTAPPVEGEANAEIERYIAKTVGVPMSNVSVVSGSTSRQKILEISGTTAAAVSGALTRALEQL